MSVESILQELKKERDQLNRVIAALEGMDSTSQKVGRPKRSAQSAEKRGGGITAAGRRRLSEAMKRRWAERRKKSS